MSNFGNLAMIGDSLFRGSDGFYYSPAQKLKSLLVADGHTATFVGTHLAYPGDVPVCANGGRTIALSDADIPNVSALNPDTLVVSIGTNDVGVPNTGVGTEVTNYLNALVAACTTVERTFVAVPNDLTWFDDDAYTRLKDAMFSWVALDTSKRFVTNLSDAGLVSGDYYDSTHWLSSGADKIAALIYSRMAAAAGTTPSVPTTSGTIRIRGGGVAALHTAALAQTSGSQKSYWSTNVISTYIGANARLELWRDGVKVYDDAMSGTPTVDTNGSIVLPSALTPPAIANVAADIDTGTWIFRIVKAADSAKYLEGTVGKTGSGANLILSMDLDGTATITLDAILLQPPADLDSGYIPPTTGIPVYSPQSTVNDMGLQNDHNAYVYSGWNAPAWATGQINGVTVTPASVVMGNRGRPDELESWWTSQSFAADAMYPWRRFLPWWVILFGSGHTGDNNAVKTSKVKMIGRRRSDGVWVVITTPGSHGWMAWRPSTGGSPAGAYMPTRELDGGLVSEVYLGNPMDRADSVQFFPHGWGSVIPFDPTPYDCLLIAALVSLELWNPAGADNRATSQITYQLGGDYYPNGSLPWYPGAGASRLIKVTSTPRWCTWANLSNCRQSYIGPNASVSVSSFLQNPPPRSLVEA